ncbi:hypothetical protein A2572_02125 [Candidatus Collierbacteria bacterium RIFOXYD1_FULL_40_9]|uniref:Rhodanese domain-containing protein n=1 Tax=Candidatus Collierbacteria bacterium RIFOXYD1_FULL_40_9 TaxID=1817731 RepID=A0A1F5FT65_9BACT|nr:MAG: hypothetical protein A2572_02125 [Candidatus Collierbacteria bacterium RIFOXYD1_FULL_40_9]
MKNILTRDLNAISNLQVVDVRTPEEFQEGHLPNATNLPVESLISGNHQSLDKATPLLIYCESGARSQIACQILDQQGYQTYNLLGGYTAWLAHNSKR